MIRLAIPLVLLTGLFWLYFFMQSSAVHEETRKALKQWGIAGTAAVGVLVVIALAFSLQGAINGN
jgi:hypothetical protein